VTRVALVAVALVAGLGACGDDGGEPPERSPVSGGEIARTFEVDARAAYLECRGEGEPTHHAGHPNRPGGSA
jgi:hypothetical protein